MQRDYHYLDVMFTYIPNNISMIERTSKLGLRNKEVLAAELYIS